MYRNKQSFQSHNFKNSQCSLSQMMIISAVCLTLTAFVLAQKHYKSFMSMSSQSEGTWYPSGVLTCSFWKCLEEPWPRMHHNTYIKQCPVRLYTKTKTLPRGEVGIVPLTYNHNASEDLITFTKRINQFYWNCFTRGQILKATILCGVL